MILCVLTTEFMNFNLFYDYGHVKIGIARTVTNSSAGSRAPEQLSFDYKQVWLALGPGKEGQYNPYFILAVFPIG